MTPWTVARQAPLSMGLSRQEYWSGLPFPSPGDLSNPGTELGSPALQADSLPSELTGFENQVSKQSYLVRLVVSAVNSNPRLLILTPLLFPFYHVALLKTI